ncbi:MAG TPA: amidohydrolase family protein [Verrucomicrobiae bacterium]
MTRRKFVTALVATATTAPGAGSSSAVSRLAPAKIIDTHTHFYDPSRPQGVPWPKKEDEPLYRTVLPKNYKALPVPQPVDGVIVVEASPWIEDNQWVLDLASTEKFIVGFVGNLPVGQTGFRPGLKRFSANRLFRGIRVSGVALTAGLKNAAFVADLHLLADANLALDVVHLGDVLPAIERLAREAPNLRVVIDHVANVKIDGKEPPAGWSRDIAAAGARANVFCKVSGLVEGTGRTDGSAPADSGYYRPVLDTVWRAFGAERLIYGSNWPVSERFAKLGMVQQIATDYFTAKGQEALDQVLWQNSLSAYRWIRR